MDKLKPFLPPVEKCPNISFTMRLFSYLVCLVVGFIMVVTSICELFLYNTPHYRSFALWYTLSNIIWLISTFILIGPREHYRKLIGDELYAKSIILIFFIILGLLFGFLTSSKGINIFLSILQFISVIVFNYSYLFLSNKRNTENIENEYQNNNNLFNELK